MRLRDEKPKTKTRMEMEKAWTGNGGFPREGSHNMHVFTFPGEKAKLDKLGVLQIKEGGRTTGGIMKQRVK